MIKGTIKEIKKALPTLESEKVEVLADELDKVLALKQLWTSDGGKQLITVLRNNCASALQRLITISRTKPELESMLGAALDYASSMDLLTTVQDINLETELRLQLDEAVKEAMGRSS